jgi:hypothetical protein
MLKMRIIAVMTLCVCLLLAGCGGASAPPAEEDYTASGSLSVSFSFERQSGHASNQFAVWIEDADGTFVKTVFATDYTANGGYKNRPESIAVWAERSGLAERSEVDSFTGATPKTGELTYVWDITGENGQPVPEGKYKFFVEGSLRWKNSVLYTGEVEIGPEPASAVAEPRFNYAEAPGQPALDESSSERNMLGSVTAQYIPPERAGA